MSFQWDDNKRQRVIPDRNVDLLYAALVFEGPILTGIDDKEDYGEVREISLGIVDGECFVVVHTDREGKTRLITAWKGGREEHDRYEEGVARRHQENERSGELHDPKALFGGEVLGPEFWASARLKTAEPPRSVHLKLDPEVFAFFKGMGKGHLTKMQDILKAYVKAHTPV